MKQGYCDKNGKQEKETISFGRHCLNALVGLKKISKMSERFEIRTFVHERLQLISNLR